MSVEPWYGSGLCFGCQRCGACCGGAPGYVWIRAAEAAALAGQLGMGIPEFLSRHARSVGEALSLREESDGRCVLFDPGLGCRAYAARPRQCRTWPFWPRVLASRAAWDREAETCPGMGRGQVYGSEEIEGFLLPPGPPAPGSA